jgi:hypothetical protein
MNSHPYTTDTSPEALEVQLDCLRRMSPEERLRRTLAMSYQVKQMCFNAIRRQNPEMCEQEVKLKFIELTYGEALSIEVRNWLKERGLYGVTT